MLKILRKIKDAYRKNIAGIYYRMIFGSFGNNSMIVKPSAIDEPRRIFIGSNVIVAHGAWLAAVPHTGNQNCSLVIGSNTYIGRFSHIYAVSKITIGKKVLIADKVYISDNTHTYQNISMAVIEQPVVDIKPVEIKEGAWLGENVCIIGATIGRNSVVAANAVVLKDVPDYCVVAGSPAIIIKRYNQQNGVWMKTNPEGDFI
jgi:acetyltransferase-like isoleucine patch superfamily enzyme